MSSTRNTTTSFNAKAHRSAAKRPPGFFHSPIRIPQSAIPLLLLPALALTGCQYSPVVPVTPPPSMRLNTAPIVVDEAMQRRDWDRSVAYYENGVTVAGPTGHYVTANPTYPELAQGAIESPVFAAESALLPVYLFLTPPWEDVAYPRAQAEPSYTAVPPSNTTY